MTRSLAICSVILSSLLAVTASAANPAGSDESRLRSTLDLTPAQVTELTKLRDVQRSAVSPLRLKIRSERSELRSLWRSSHPNRARIQAKMATIDGLRLQVGAAKLDFRFGLHQILNEKQRVRLSDHLAKRPE
jgi:Spy/CpxP family protein refolding chaperone